MMHIFFKNHQYIAWFCWQSRFFHICTMYSCTWVLIRTSSSRSHLATEDELLTHEKLVSESSAVIGMVSLSIFFRFIWGHRFMKFMSNYCHNFYATIIMVERIYKGMRNNRIMRVNFLDYSAKSN